ncbi:hypothetical protein LOC59_10300 [Arthrobacter sp. zg-Y916]|uniref:hypothetical protein n=1 Tax=Arthrobacter sp. zg-Y916 TaxID=2894190 RepID=UPI001E4CAA33|nr:hypothetical protein [Arthrobacter sp. zg-Y916]MCC9194028.1 hypothetical protein [Arthrobacter sp. zg-Y916]
MSMNFLFSAEADLDGQCRRSLARRCTSGELIRLRQGIYVKAYEWRNLAPWERERTRLAAAVQGGQSQRVLIQQSAAAIWGIPTIGSSPQIMFLAPGDTHGRSRGDLRWAERRLLEPVTSVDGLAVTGRAQTVLDMAANLPFERSVPAMDHVLRPDVRRALPPMAKEELRDLAQGLRAHTKRARALRVIDFADPRSESPGESYSRALLYRYGFPAPDLQHQFRSTGGQLLGRTDFFWEEQNLVGEFDGAIKYGSSLNGGELQAQQALIREKRREDAIRATGVRFVRWTWAEASRPSMHPDGLVALLARAGLPRSRRAVTNRASTLPPAARKAS